LTPLVRSALLANLVIFAIFTIANFIAAFITTIVAALAAFPQGGNNRSKRKLNWNWCWLRS
jgi:hypothetical protein